MHVIELELSDTIPKQSVNRPRITKRQNGTSLTLFFQARVICARQQLLLKYQFLYSVATFSLQIVFDIILSNVFVRVVCTENRESRSLEPVPSTNRRHSKKVNKFHKSRLIPLKLPPARANSKHLPVRTQQLPNSAMTTDASFCHAFWL